MCNLLFLNKRISGYQASPFQTDMGNQDPRKSRGGHGLFEWDKIKDDKYSGNYLGASLKAATGRCESVMCDDLRLHWRICRWAKNRDLEWFAKPSSRDEALQSDVSKEMAEIKRLEAEAFAEALGFSGPKTLTLAAAQDSVSQAELMRVVTAEAERDLVAPGPEGVTAAQGVGFGHGYPTLGKGQLTGTNNIQDIVTAHLPISTGGMYLHILRCSLDNGISFHAQRTHARGSTQRHRIRRSPRKRRKTKRKRARNMEVVVESGLLRPRALMQTIKIARGIGNRGLLALRHDTALADALHALRHDIALALLKRLLGVGTGRRIIETSPDAMRIGDNIRGTDRGTDMIGVKATTDEKEGDEQVTTLFV